MRLLELSRISMGALDDATETRVALHRRLFGTPLPAPASTGQGAQSW